MMKLWICLSFMVNIPGIYAQPANARIEVTNPSAFQRIDEPVVVSRKSLTDVLGALPASQLPVVMNQKGEYIPSQCDDVDGDGQWDELAFVCNLEPRQRLNFEVKLVSAKEIPVFTPRTHVAFDKVSGKISLGMQMDTGNRPSGSKTVHLHHTLYSWERHIYSGDAGFGFCAPALQTDDILPCSSKGFTDRRVDSTVFTLINSGPVRAIFKLDDFGRYITGKTYNLHRVITLWAGRQGYESKVRIEGDSGCDLLATGIACGDKDGILGKKYVPGLTGLITHRKGSANGEYAAGMALLVPVAGCINDSGMFPGGYALDKDTAYVKLKFSVRPVTWYVYSGLEQEDERFGDKDYFIKMITHEAAMINMRAVVKVLGTKK